MTTSNETYSGFHQGAGEAVVADLLARNIADYSLVVIDEVETSLHPRAQRRLIRDLAQLSRQKKIQFIFTTHSPYVLQELPPEARIYVSQTSQGKSVNIGVSPEYALSEMDEQSYPEHEVYVEDNEARVLTREILTFHAPDTVRRVTITSYGSAQVGKSLGQMAKRKAFRVPTTVLLDGDQEPAEGCGRLPGEMAPESTVFKNLTEQDWQTVACRIDRSFSRLYDSSNYAMTSQDHKEWITTVADKIVASGDILWTIMCSVFVKQHVSQDEVRDWVEKIEESLS